MCQVLYIYGTGAVCLSARPSVHLSIRISGFALLCSFTEAGGGSSLVASSAGLRSLSRAPKPPARQKKWPLFLSFPHVCPESVLVKQCILYINGAKKDFSHLLDLEPPPPLACLSIKTMPTVRDATDGSFSSVHSQRQRRAIVLCVHDLSVAVAAGTTCTSSGPAGPCLWVVCTLWYGNATFCATLY